MTDKVSVSYKPRTVKVKDDDMKRLVAGVMGTLEMVYPDDSKQGSLVKAEVKSKIWSWFQGMNGEAQ